MDWRKRLDELEKQVQQATDRGEFVGVRDRLAWDITMDHVPKLIEGYRLLAEAVEAVDRHEQHRVNCGVVFRDGVCEQCDHLRRDKRDALTRALAHLRSVGNA